MVSQQFVAPPAIAAMFIVLTVDEGGEDTVRDLIPALSGLGRTVSFRTPESHFVPVTGISAALWDRLYGKETRPKGLRPFEEIRGDKHTAVATPGDLLLHLRATRMDSCFQFAKLVTDRLRGAATVVDEVHGFRYYDDRDLLGFVDGTENPEGVAADEAVIITEDDDAPYAGGSYVVVQKYLHNMASWEAQSTEEQERVIGRTKLDDVEMADDVKPANSHIALNVIEDDDGNQLQILRDNVPFGEVATGEYGTYFIGYAKDPSVIETMLQNMFIGNPPGTYDRILDFSTAETGCLFFTPSLDWLDDPTPVKRASDAADEPASTDPPAEHQSVDATGPITTPADDVPVDAPGPPSPTDTEPAQGEPSPDASSATDDAGAADTSSATSPAGVPSRGSLGIGKVANEPY